MGSLRFYGDFSCKANMAVKKRAVVEGKSAHWKPALWNPLFEESRPSTSEGQIAGYMRSVW